MTRLPEEFPNHGVPDESPNVDLADSRREIDITAGGSQVAVTNAALAGVAFVTSIATARYFGPDGRGLLSLILLWPTLFIGLAHLGLPHATTYFAAKNPADAGRWVGTSAVLAVASGLMFALVGFFFVEQLIPADKESIVWPARMMMLGVGLQPLIGVTLHPWRGLGRFTLWNTLRAAVDLVPLLILISVVVLGSKNFTTWVTIQIALVAATCVVSVMTWRFRGLSWHAKAVSPLLRYGLPTALAVVPFSFSFRIDQVFLANNQTANTLGQYVVAAGWGLACLPVLNTLALLALPRVMKTAGDSETVVRHVRFSVLVAILLGVGLAAVSPVVVPILFGSDFEEAGRIALILVPASAILGLGTILEELLRALGRPRSPLYAQVASLTFTLATIGWATDRWGVWGAATVSILAYSFAAFLLMRSISSVVAVPVHCLVTFGSQEFDLVRRLIRRGRPMASRRK